MDSNNYFLEKYLNLAPIITAIEQYYRGEQVTVRCLKGKGLLTVSMVKPVDTVWVACPNGCTRYHETYKQGTLADK